MIATRGGSRRAPGPGLLPWSRSRPCATRSNHPPTIIHPRPRTQHSTHKKNSSTSSAPPSPAPRLKPRLRPTEPTAPAHPPHPEPVVTATPARPSAAPRPASVDRRPAGFDLSVTSAAAAGRSPRRHGEEAAAAAGARARARGGAVGAALAVGQDGLLPRLHARLAAPRLRAAAPYRPPRPAPPARAPLQLPPRRRRPRRRAHPPRPGQGLPLPLLPRRPPRRLRRPLPPHPLRVHGVRGRRGLPVGGGGLQRRLPLLRPRQGRRGLRRGRRRRRRPRAARQGPAPRRGGHVPYVARARRRAPRHGLPGQQPREAPAPRRLQDRHRSSKVEGNPHAQVAEAMHRMTPARRPVGWEWGFRRGGRTLSASSSGLKFLARAVVVCVHSD